MGILTCDVGVEVFNGSKLRLVYGRIWNIQLRGNTAGYLGRGSYCSLSNLVGWAAEGRTITQALFRQLSECLYWAIMGFAFLSDIVLAIALNSGPSPINEGIQCVLFTPNTEY